MWEEDTDAASGPPGLSLVLQVLLETSLQQNQLSQEMVWGLHATIQELLNLWQMAPAVATTLPSPNQDAQHPLTKLSTDDDVRVFLGTFEDVTIREGWPESC